jgi:predicted nucleic acid-binding protein
LIVLDASAAICLLLYSPETRADRIRGRISLENIQAPYLIDVEVAQALRRLVRLGELDESRALEALQDFGALRLRRHPHLPLLDAVWRMRDNRTAYDAAYVALAEALYAPVVTADARMARTPAGTPVEVY